MQTLNTLFNKQFLHVLQCKKKKIKKQYRLFFDTASKCSKKKKPC